MQCINDVDVHGLVTVSATHIVIACI